MSEPGKLAAKKALVTGAGTGIGREIALEFARQGADVALHYAHSGTGAESAVDEVRERGGRAVALKADFASVEEAAGLVDRVIHALGGLDCLVNNAGITFNKPFLEVTPEQCDLMYCVNVRAPYAVTQQAVRHMVEHGGGAICNLTSIHGLQGAPEHSVYAGTKGAIIAQTRAMGVELAHRGIRVNAIAPGCVPVESYHKVVPGYSDESMRSVAETAIPVARPGKPVEIAKLAAFLCSDDAGFIIGQTMVADGGTTVLMSLISDCRNPLPTRFGAGYLPGM